MRQRRQMMMVLLLLLQGEVVVEEALLLLLVLVLMVKVIERVVSRCSVRRAERRDAGGVDQRTAVRLRMPQQ